MCQDETILRSDSKIRRFLETQHVPFEVGTSPEVLRAKARARMKRIAEEGVDDSAKRALFDDGPVLSIAKLKKVIENIVETDRSQESFHSITFSIIDLNAANAFTVRKHSKVKGQCQGIMNSSGICYKCGEYAAGVQVYSFKALLADLDDEKLTIIATCAEGAGKSLFDNKEASDFDALSVEMKKDAIEKNMFVPKKGNCWIKYEADKGQSPFVVIFKIRDAF